MNTPYSTSWLLKRLRVMRDALRECEAYFEERADAEYFTDSASPVGNEEMRMLGEVIEALWGPKGGWDRFFDEMGDGIGPLISPEEGRARIEAYAAGCEVGAQNERMRATKRSAE